MVFAEKPSSWGIVFGRERSDRSVLTNGKRPNIRQAHSYWPRDVVTQEYVNTQGLEEFSKVMQTHNFVSDLHN